MLDRLNRMVRIGIAETGIALVASHGWPRRRASVLADQALATSAQGHVGAMLEQLAERLADAGCRAAPAAIALADSWVRYFFVTPPRNAASLRDCRAACAMRFEILYGDRPDAWLLTADWSAGRPFLACAMPRALHAGLHAAAAPHALRVASIVPHFALAWNRWHAQLNGPAWLVVAHHQAVTLAMLDRKGPLALRTLLLPAAPDTAWLRHQMEREALRNGLDMPARLYLHTRPDWLAADPPALQCTVLDGGAHASLSPAMQLLRSQGGRP